MMDTPQNMVRRLRDSGLSALEISVESDVSMPTIYRIMNGEAKTNKTNSALIANIYDKFIGSLFDAKIDQLFLLRDTYFDKLSKNTISQTIELVLLAAVRNHEDYDKGNLNSARLFWFEAEILEDVDKLNRAVQHAEDVPALYKKAMKIIEVADVPEDKETLRALNVFKLAHNILASKHDRLAPEERKSTDNLALFEEIDYINKAKKLMTYEPWNWRPARAGLAVASLLSDMKSAKYFYQRLIAIDSRFKNFDYSPSIELPSINDDADFDVFRNSFQEVI